MTKPILILSDIHAHDWNIYSTRDATGLNSRLKITLNEIERAVNELAARKGHKIILCGDLFHTRGELDPEVFNPVFRLFAELSKRGFDFIAIPGNHDLKSKDTTELGNAIQTFATLPRFEVITVPTLNLTSKQAFLPWISTKDGIRAAVKAMQDQYGPSVLAETDLFMHTGINGVLIGVPDHALDASEVASWGFKRVFSGDYHHHKSFDDKVFSIGALTHQTWGDVGTRAGYLFITDTTVEYRASHAPQFVELTDITDDEQRQLTVDGNYVRVRNVELTQSEEVELKRLLVSEGAAGVSIQAARKVVSARAGGGVVTKSATLEASVSAYVTEKKYGDREKAIQAECADILNTARSRATSE